MKHAYVWALLKPSKRALSLADGVIAFYDTKYPYNFWRPVTAIRGAALDGNLGKLADPNWLPEVTNTTPDPSYPGAHAVISAAAASVLNSFFGKKDFDFVVTSEVLPGATRSFTNFSAANKEATLSRIFAGVHFRTDLTSGQRMGSEVADFVVDNLDSRSRERRFRRRQIVQLSKVYFSVAGGLYLPTNQVAQAQYSMLRLRRNRYDRRLSCSEYG